MLARGKKSKGGNEKTNHVKVTIGNLVQILSPLKSTHQVGIIGSLNNMHIWTLENWKNNLPPELERRAGIRFRYDPTVDPEVRRALMQFSKWLRKEYIFPLRIQVYVKGTPTVRAKDGDMVAGLFFEPEVYSWEPYILIATGDYDDLCQKNGKDNALASILSTLCHELTHYYQWINGIALTDIGMERQAARYASYILSEYAETCEHP